MPSPVRYNFRLRPSKAARRALEAEWDRARFVWNSCIEQQLAGDELYRTTGEASSVSPKQMNAWLTKVRGEFDWLGEGSQVVQQQAIRTWGQAYSRSCSRDASNRLGRPKFKSRRRSLPSLEYTRNGFSIKEVDGARRLVLAKGISIPVVWSRELPSEPSSCRVTRDALGHWYVSFVVRVDDVEPLEPTGRSIGIDWGLKALATTTDASFDLPNKRHARRNHDAFAKAQRKMARRRRPKGSKPSKGYLLAKNETARLYAKCVRQRRDDAQKWAKKVVAAHDVIAVEDFKPKFMSKNRSLARSASDAAIGDVKRILVERGMRAGRRVVLVDPKNTSQTCSSCGARAKQRLELDVRVFDCDECELVVDRDVNAARNILARAGQVPVITDDVTSDRASSHNPASEMRIPRL